MNLVVLHLDVVLQKFVDAWIHENLMIEAE